MSTNQSSASYRSRPSDSSLLRDVQTHIRTLEGAISDVGAARDHLKKTSMETKTDIQTTMTQQLEALRARELELLRRVDQAEETQDAALRGHEDKLQHTLGGLNNILELGAAAAGEQAANTLNRLKNLELRSPTVPHMSFVADVSGLGAAMSGFGRVDLDTLSPVGLGGVAAGRPAMGSCLPRAFEDYDDDEHHVLYRNIGNDREKLVTVSIPPLSRRPEDWLLSTPPLCPPSPQSPVFAPFLSTTLAGWLSDRPMTRSTSSSAASIHQWLCDIQAQAGLEEEEGGGGEFEMISPASRPHRASTRVSSSIEVLTYEDPQLSFPSDSSPPTTASEDDDDDFDATVTPSASLPYFQQVLATPAGSWLLTPATYDPQLARPGYSNEVLRYFREISDDTKDWLLQYNNKAVEEPCPPTASCAQVSHTPVDIENLDQLVCIKDPVAPYYYSQLPTDPKCWLQGGAAKDEDMDLDEAAADVNNVMSVCKANEPCETFFDCLDDGNCCQKLAAAAAAPKKSEPTPEAFPYFEAANQKTWLLRSDKNRLSITDAVVPDIPSVVADDGPSNSSWLMSPKSSSCTSPSDDVRDGNNPWLLPTPSSTSNLDRQDLTSTWEARFCHKISSVEKPPAICLSNNWLSSPTHSYKISTPSLSAFSEKSQTVSWLHSEESSEDNRQTEKRTTYGKQLELPECEDEPGTDSHPLTNALLSCFPKQQQQQPISGNDRNNIWLLSNNQALVD